MLSLKTPLDNASPSSYRLSIVTVPLSVTVWPQFAMQILTGVSIPNPISQIFTSRWGPGSLSNTMLLGTTRVFLSNGISLRPTALAGCMSVTHIHTDRLTTLRFCWNRRHYRFQRAVPPNNNNNNNSSNNKNLTL